MDAAWALSAVRLSGVMGLITIVIAVVSIFLVSSKIERYLCGACAAWVIMNELWLLSEFFPSILLLHIPVFMAVPGAVMLIMTTVVVLNKQDSQARKDLCGLICTIAWFSMDVAWLLELMPLALAFGIVSLVTSILAVFRSENKAVALVNGAMLCWMMLLVAQLLSEMFEFSVLYAYPVFASLVLALLVAGFIVSHNNPKVFAIFRPARLSAHMPKDALVSFMPPSDMDIVAVQNDGFLELRVTGRIDALTADRFLKTICEHADNGQLNIRVDASQVNYISSLGLRVLLQSHRKLASLNGSFKICKASSAALQIIFMAGMDSLLEIK